MLNEHDDAAAQIDHDHHWHETGGHRTDGLDAAHQHRADTDEEEDRGQAWVNVEGILQTLGHSVGLGEVTDAEGRDDRGDREEPGQEFTEPALDAVLQVALWATGDVALGIRGAETNAQEGLGVLGCHTD